MDRLPSLVSCEQWVVCSVVLSNKQRLVVVPLVSSGFVGQDCVHAFHIKGTIAVVNFEADFLWFDLSCLSVLIPSFFLPFAISFSFPSFFALFQIFAHALSFALYFFLLSSVFFFPLRSSPPSFSVRLFLSALNVFLYLFSFPHNSVSLFWDPHSLSNAEVKNAWSYTSTPQYVFTAWCSVKKDRDNFTFTFNFISYLLSLLSPCTHLSTLFETKKKNLKIFNSRYFIEPG